MSRPVRKEKPVFSITVENDGFEESKGDALKLLRSVGITDPELRPLKFADQQTEGKSPKPLAFVSPRAGGIYYIDPEKKRIDLYLYETIVIRYHPDGRSDAAS